MSGVVNPGGRANQRMLQLTLEAYGWVCHLCLRPIRSDLPRRHPDGPTRDHVIPTSKGGPDTLENSRPAHGRCNFRRGNRPLTAELLAAFRRPVRSFDGAGFFGADPWTTRSPCPVPPKTSRKNAELQRSNGEGPVIA